MQCGLVDKEMEDQKGNSENENFDFKDGGLESKQGNAEFENEVDLAREFGNFAGRADVLEAFYCYEESDVLSDFGLGNSVKSLPAFPVELRVFRTKTFQVQDII